MNAPRDVPATGALSPTSWYLPFEEVNRANDVAHKLRSVLECIRSASLMELAGAECPDDWDAYVAECLTKARSE